MMTGLSALETFDWSRLHHAYGPATDTPAHLRALVEGDSETRDKAMAHLWSAILHQGTPWTATGPVAAVVAGLLSDDRLNQDDPIRGNLVSFLVGVAEVPKQAASPIDELQEMAAFDIERFLDSDDAETLYLNQDARDSFHARSILGCINVAPVLMAVMLEGLGNVSPRIRLLAAMGR